MNSMDTMFNGEDANDEGIITRSLGESCLLIAYEHALKMGSFELFNAQDVATSNEWYPSANYAQSFADALCSRMNLLEAEL